MPIAGTFQKCAEHAGNARRNEGNAPRTESDRLVLLTCVGDLTAEDQEKGDLGRTTLESPVSERGQEGGGGCSIDIFSNEARRGATGVRRGYDAADPQLRVPKVGAFESLEPVSLSARNRTQ